MFNLAVALDSSIYNWPCEKIGSGKYNDNRDNLLQRLIDGHGKAKPNVLSSFTSVVSVVVV
jgi:hypothetical protein